MSATRSIEQIKWISYSAPIFYLYFLIEGRKELKNKELQISLFLVVAFGFWALCTSLWSTYPSYSFLRSIVFIVSSVSLIVGGFSWAKYFKGNEFGFLTPLNIILLIISLFSLMTKIPNDYWAGYGYGLKSFWGHQNTLASIVIFSIPGIFIIPMRKKKYVNIISILLLITNLYILLQTHSRTSLVVFIISGLLLLVLLKRYKILVSFILIFATISVLYLVNTNIQTRIKNYLFKTEVSLLDRKKPIISASYYAAGIGGWKGLGFGVSDNTVLENLQINLTYHFEGVRLVREKGVSVYALIEETGWVGLFLFVIFLGYLYYMSILNYSNNINWSSALMICILIGMTLHAQLEGWWLGVGSVQFPLFMGIAGVIIGKIRKPVQS